MAKIKLELDQTLEAALKYPNGLHYDSDYPDKRGRTMFSTVAGDSFYIDENYCDEPNRLFSDAGISKGQPFRLTMRKRNGQRYYELTKTSAAPPAQPQWTTFNAPQNEAPSPLESQLQASISHVQQQKRAQQQPEPSQVFNGRPNAGTLMELSLMTAVDVCLKTQAYAESMGAEIVFDAEAIQKIGVTFYMDARKDPLFDLRQPVNGGAQPWRQ